MKYLEAFTLLVFGFGFYFFMKRWPGGSIMMITSLGSLSAFYFVFGFNFFNNIRLRDSFKKDSYKGLSTLRIIGGILAGINLSILLIGILFGLMRWPGFTIMILVSLIPSIIILILSIIKQLSGTENSYIRLISRIGFFLGFACVLYFYPMIIQQIRYQEQPRILNAYKRFYEEPTDENRKLLDAEMDRYALPEKEFNTKYKDSI